MFCQVCSYLNKEPEKLPPSHGQIPEPWELPGRGLEEDRLKDGLSVRISVMNSRSGRGPAPPGLERRGQPTPRVFLGSSWAGDSPK
jgi:hypothetical protein